MGKDTTNLSKLRREKLLAAIKEIKEGIKDPDKITALNEIENELLEMKYGLKWEKHEEQVDRDLLTKIPVFKEDKEREIVKTDGEFNFLLEGDNLHSLMLLEKTHRNAIDVIYIDPPYNTGNKDFKYGDKNIDEEDDYRHSKWLSFMERRLKIAYELLTDSGIIFISIDDNEFPNLKLLMDRVFGEINFIANLIRKTSYGEKTAKPHINKHHEYCIVYSKNISKLISNSVFIGDEKTFSEYKNPDNDQNGEWKKDSLLIKIDNGRKGLARYGIYNPYLGTTDYPPVYHNEDDRKQWHYVESTFNKLLKNNQVVYYKTLEEKGSSNYGFFIKKYKKDVSAINKNISTLYFDSNEYVNAKGTESIRSIFKNKSIFANSYPKPTNFISALIGFYKKKNAIILDFFAGSGTTGQSVLELNKEDGGNRKFILCTNNEIGETKKREFKKLHGDKEDHPDKWAAWEDEHGIARSVTYKRLEKVINGYTTPKGKDVEGIPANLKYYKTEYIPREMEDDDYDAHDEINKYIIELIQLEFAIDIHNPKIGLVLSDEYMESENFNVKEIDDKKLNDVEDIYIAEGLILPDGLQEKISKRGIRLHWVPQYYKF